MPAKSLPPADYLRECFSYDPETGDLTWNARPREHFGSTHIQTAWNTKYCGKRSGYLIFDGGGRSRRYVTINDELYYAHRIIWKMMTGEDPPATVDHRDTDQDNNRWLNLRIANETQQKWNMNIRSDNTSGFKGVSFHKQSGKYGARAMIDGAYRNLGLFDTPEEASAAYQAVARKLHGEFYRP